MSRHNGVTRIFVDCHVFDGGFQGTRTYIKGLYQELVKDHTRHFFLAASDIGKLKKEFGEQSNITYLKYSSANKIFRLLLETPYLIRKHKIDFAHFQYRVPPVKLCRYIVTTHDVLFEDFPEHFPKLNRISSLLTYKFSARMAELVLTVSHYSKIQIQKYLGVSDAVITPNGIEELFFEGYDKDAVQDKVRQTFGFSDYLIYISRREPRKNQHLLLRHFVDLKLYEKFQLVLVGHETFKNPAFDVIYNQLDPATQKRIHCVDHIGFDQMLALLRGARAFIYPSIAEGFGIPPLEAAAAGIPVLCSNQTAMSDFDFFGEMLFNPNDETEFREKLLRITAETPDQARLGQIAHAIRTRYNWQNAAHIFDAAVAKIN